MKKRFILVSVILLACISIIILSNGNFDLIGISKAKIALAGQTEDLVVKYKTTENISITWENMIIPDGVVKYTVDSIGKITNITDYAGRSYTVTYTNNKVSKITDPLNREIKYYYNTNGLLSEVIGLNNKSTYYEYNQDGCMTRIKEVNDFDQTIITETMTYIKDSMNMSKISTIQNVSGKLDTYSYNVSDGYTSITDQNGRITTKYFDSKGYTTREVEPNNLETLITYTEENGVNKYGEIESRVEITGQTISYDRDSKGNIIKQTNTDNSYKTFEYNSKNSLTKEIDELGNETEYVYNTDGITLFKKIMPNDAEITFEYYSTGIKGLVYKKTDELGKDTIYEYDNYGNITKMTNALLDFETYTYNQIGWLLSKTTCEGYTTTYEYDNSGNNNEITENGIATTVNNYNYKNNLVKTIDANNNIITYDYDYSQNLIKKIDQEENITYYLYDTYNNLIRETKPNGALYRYQYDTINRNTKTTIEISDDVLTTLEEKEYSYNSGNKTIITKQYSNDTDYITNTKVYNYLDKIISDKTELAEKTYTYLNNGLVSLEQNEIGRRIYYYYNSLNKVSTKYEEIDNDYYKRTNYGYDDAGNVILEETSKEKVLLIQAPTTYIKANYLYDDIGNMILKTTSSGEEFKYTYDKDKNIAKEEVKIENDKYKITEYTYNYAKKVISKEELIEEGSLITNSIDDTNLISLTTLYEYDNMNNLTKETAPDGVITNHYYDKLNRKIKNEIIKDDKTITEETTYLNDSKDKVSSTADGNGNITTYKYDIFSNISKEIKPNEVTTIYGCNFLGNIEKEILPNFVENNESTNVYEYDKYGNVISKTRKYLVGEEGKQIKTTYEYDLSGNLLGETTAEVSQSSTYNKAGKVITKTDGNGNVTIYEYDANLNVISETDPRETVTNYFYDERNNLIRKEIDDVVQEEYTYDLINNKITEKDELGLIITNTYDINSNLVKQVNSSTNYIVENQYNLSKELARVIDNYNKETLYKYDMLDNVIEETEQKNDETEAITTKAKYDNLSNKIETTDGNGNITTYEYDSNNNLVEETNPKLQTTTYTYDKNSNQLTETDYLNNTLTNVYDNLDRLVEKFDQYDSRIEKLVYDDLGRQTESIDANDNVIYYSYDNNNNITSKKDQEGHKESYEYDENNNKVKYTDKNNNVTNYEYNNKNELTKVINALLEENTYTYDNKGNMLTQTDPLNHTITFEYDINSNEISKIDQLGNEETKIYYPNGLQETFTSNNGDVFTYTYDIHGRLINENVGQEDIVYEYDNNDNQTQIGNITRTYDNLNRLLTNTESSQTVTYAYDDTLKKVTITDPKSNVTVEEYDKANRLIKVTNNSDITEYVYNLDGSVKKQINPNETSTYEYYPDNKIKRLTTKDVNDILIEENYYEYDNNNNVTKENSKVFTYDALNRIATSDDTEYDYDGAGNILSKSILDGSTLKVTGYSYNEKNQLLSAVTLENITVTSESTYTYDDNGNQLTETTNLITTTNTYNPRNELIEVNDGQTVAEYVYNAEGKRIQKAADNITTNYIYDGDNIILELDDQNDQVANNIYGLALIKRTTDTEGYYLYNGHGDVTKILDDTNTILNTYVYDNFGKIISETGTFNNPYKYAGYYYDSETQTYYLQARYYNPEIQRFITEDTYRGNIDDPLSLNLYTYVKNNPLIYTDPSGHFFKEIGAGFKYIGERAAAILDAGSELLYDSVIGLGNLGYSIVETGVAEVGLISNYVGNKVGLFDQSQYKTNKENLMSTINENGQMYLNLPKNMINGIKDNFSQTFNLENFKNYLNPNTSYNELKDYSKSVIQTGVTVYGGYQLGKFAYNKLSQIYQGTQFDKFSNVKFNNNLESKAKGWKVGDPIDNLTKAGNEPSWSTVRARYWKNEAMNNPFDYSVENLNLMNNGRAPFDVDLGVSMEIHHINGRNIMNPNNINNLMKVWPWQHAEIDKFRFYNGPRP
jgi:RHS repeat-associated protein